MTVLKILAIVLVIAVAAFFLGPRPDSTTDITFSPEAMGEDIDAYLEASEKRVANLTNGAEKQIVWQDPQSKAKTPVSLVYLHGFSATKEEIRPVPDMIANQLGANLFYARLAGHGQSGDELATATLSEWIDDTAEAIEIGRRIGDRVIVMGTSTGATLATWAAAQPELADKIDAMVFVSPNFAVKGVSTEMANLPWAETWLPMLAGDHRSWEPANPQQGKWWTTSYPTKAIFPMMTLLKTVSDIDKTKIRVPTLFVYSPEDTVIEAYLVEEVEKQWGAQSRAVAVETRAFSKHVIAGDILDPGNNELLTKTSLDWLREIGL